MKYQILAVPFLGFYGTCWGDMIDRCEQDEKDLLVERYNVDRDFLDQCVEAENGWRTRCKEQIAQWYCERYFSLLSEFTGINFEVLSISIDSPQYYNFQNDKLIATVSVRMKRKKMFGTIRNLMHEHFDELDKIVRSNHTSCNGFWSYMSNDINDWFSKIEDSSQPYLDYVLGYITHLRARETQWARAFDSRDFLEYAIYEAIVYNETLERPNLVAGCQADEDKWEDIQAEVIAIEHRRKIEANHPKIPGLI